MSEIEPVDASFEVLRPSTADRRAADRRSFRMGAIAAFIGAVWVVATIPAKPIDYSRAPPPLPIPALSDGGLQQPTPPPQALPTAAEQAMGYVQHHRFLFIAAFVLIVSAIRGAIAGLARRRR